MASHKIPTIRYRRKREGKTNYKKRLALLKNRKPRILIRRSNKNILAQIIKYTPTGDVVEAVAHSKELEKYGWKYSKSNTPSAYLTGFLLSKKTREKQALLDLGLQKSTKGSKNFSCLKGCIDGGIKVPHSEEILPSKERIAGRHISEYASKLDKKTFQKHFSGYKKNGADPQAIEKEFEETKKRIMNVKS